MPLAAGVKHVAALMLFCSTCNASFAQVDDDGLGAVRDSIREIWGRSISVESIGSMCRLLMAVLHSELYR
jgi:hypothetical protein